MGRFSLFLALRARLARNVWRSIRIRHPFGRILAAGLLVAGLWVALFGLFYAAFIAIGQESSEFFLVIINLLLAVFFFIMFLLLTFGNALLSFASLFRSWEAAFMISKPVSPAHVFWHKVLEAMLYSLWAVVLLCFPLILAFGAAFRVPRLYYVLACGLFLAFVLISVHVGAILTVLFARFFLPSRRRVAMLMAALVLIGGFFGVGDVVRRTWMRESMDVAFWLEGPLGKLNVAQNAFLPSLWLTRGLMTAAEGNVPRALFFLGLLASNALFFGMVAYLLAERAYKRAYHVAQDYGAHFRPSPHRWVYRVAEGALGALSSVQRMIVMKDLKTFFRTPAQWGQLVLFFGVLLLYLLNVRYFQSSGFSVLSSEMRSFINLVATLLTLTTFTVRFAFPAISLEGMNFWVLGLVPAKRQEILQAKFLTALIGTLLFGAPLVLLSDLSLHVPWHIVMLHGVTLVVVGFGLGALAVGLGAMYPSLEEDDPSRSAAGFGGTLNLVLSLGFVGVVLLGLVLPNHLPAMKGSGFAEWLWAQRAMLSLGTAGLTAVLCVVMFTLGGRALERLEV